MDSPMLPENTLEWPDFSRRSSREEWMDDPDVEPELLVRTLADLGRINAFLGGHATSLRGIQRVVGNGDRPISVLDVGCGGGDLVEPLTRWASRQGRGLRYVGLDLSPVAIDCARQRWSAKEQVEFVCADLHDLAEQMSNRSFDVVHTALVLHHLQDDQVVAALQSMAALADLGVVINDLHRHPAGYLGANVVLRLLSKQPMIVHDGALSVLRGFRAQELRALAEQAGVDSFDLEWRPLFRWLAVCRT